MYAVPQNDGTNIVIILQIGTAAGIYGLRQLQMGRRWLILAKTAQFCIKPLATGVPFLSKSGHFIENDTLFRLRKRRKSGGSGRA